MAISVAGTARVDAERNRGLPGEAAARGCLSRSDRIRYEGGAPIRVPSRGGNAAYPRRDAARPLERNVCCAGASLSIGAFRSYPLVHEPTLGCRDVIGSEGARKVREDATERHGALDVQLRRDPRLKNGVFNEVHASVASAPRDHVARAVVDGVPPEV
jgi:hypothetical protein